MKNNLDGMELDINIFNHLPDAPLPKDFHENLHKKLLIAKKEVKLEELELEKIKLEKSENAEIKTDNIVAMPKKNEKFWQKTWFPRVAVAAICLCTGLGIASEMDLLNQPSTVDMLSVSETLTTTSGASDITNSDIPMVTSDYVVPEVATNGEMENRGLMAYAGVGVPLLNTTNVILTYAETAYSLDYENTKKYGELLAEIMK